MEINWEVFSAGIAVIVFSALLLVVNGLLSTFGVKAKIPWFIPTTVFVIGVLILMQSVGIITDINNFILAVLGTANIPEFVTGLVAIFIAIYEDVYKRIGVTPSGWIRLAVLIFGVILVLDGLRVLPILYYLSQIIGYAIYSIAEYLIAYPWLGFVIVLVVFIAISLLYIRVTRKGGVSA